MYHVQKSSFVRGLLLAGVAASLLGVVGIIFAPTIFNRLPPLISERIVAKPQTAAPPPLPQAIVVRGDSAETEGVAALLASLESFDVFMAALTDTVARRGERISLENSGNCRLAAQMRTPDPVRPECIRRAPSELLPGCSLAIDLRGPPDSISVAQRAWIYAVLYDGKPCPFFDSLQTAYPYRLGGKQLRPWAGARSVAKVEGPTPWSILRAIGIEPARVGAQTPE